ncbi:MAG: adenine deaminase [Sphingobacteriales bacterium]|nr:adenine deaminase [Sphingobacteriales bacterium]
MAIFINQISGNVVDVLQRRIFPATLIIDAGRIQSIEILPPDTVLDTYILPGFVDAHVHIESSMLTPYEFGRLAIPHGTLATVSDPHEIANVLGMEGVRFMLDNARNSPLHICFGAPSCVPATAFETAGATLDAAQVEQLLQLPEIGYLSEMMNFPGVIARDPLCMDKIAAAHRSGKPVDGHAPALRGEALRQYVAAGISTDHECFTADEALEKITLGMHILIREGSAAKNFEALIPLMRHHPDRLMFCSDDKHPNDLVRGHINELVARAVAQGYDLFDVLQAACINPVRHYSLPLGLLQAGDSADFIVVSDLQHFTVLQSYIKGEVLAENGDIQLPYIPAATPNHFNCSPKKPEDFALHAYTKRARVIEALEGQLITKSVEMDVRCNENQAALADPSRDMLKIAVVNRYQQETTPAVAFIKNFGLQHGAIASSVAHDSHNIIAVGCDDESLCRAVNTLIQCGGGLSAVGGDKSEYTLPLPLAGIMSAANGYELAAHYTQVDAAAKALGSTLYAPYMTLSFMALLVIPSLKLSDKGLF